MEDRSRSAQAAYVVLTLELLLLFGGAIWLGLQWKRNKPVIPPSYEAVGFIGPCPITSILVSQHSSGRDVWRAPADDGELKDAMIDEAADRWGDYSPVAGQTILVAPAEANLKPVVTAVRTAADKGQLRALNFGPGAWMEGKGDTTLTPFPLEKAPTDAGLAVVQLVRCRVETGKTLTTLQLSNQESGKPWLTIRAHPDGAFESLLGPQEKSQRVNAPKGWFCIVSVTWNPKGGQGHYRLAVRPEGGPPRQAREQRVPPPMPLEAADQMRIGDKLEAGAASSGTMEVVETVVFNRDLSTKDVMRVEDWIFKYHLSGIPAPGSVPGQPAPAPAPPK